jgi:hypothetical protein
LATDGAARSAGLSNRSLFRKPCEGRVQDNLRTWRTEACVASQPTGSGSTIAAAAACGLHSIGVDPNRDYHRLATKAVPKLAALSVDRAG